MTEYYEITESEYGRVGDKACAGHWYRPARPAETNTRTRLPRQVYCGEDSCVCQAEGY